MIVYAIFAIGVASAVVLGALLISALGRGDFAFWPPPAERSWQDYTFWGLFRIYCAATVLCALLDPATLDWDHWSRFAVGLPALAGGLGMMLYGYFFLGLDNTYGQRAGLVTDGIYAYSRNPQYVASVAATVGLALTADSPLTMTLAVGLLGLYTLFALNEEHWLFRHYGEAYADYVRRVPRFLGLRSVALAYVELAERR